MEEVIYNQKDLGMRDYPRGHLKGSISVTKVRNAFKPLGYTLAKTSHNTRINGVLRGCVVMIQDPKSGRTVYADTEDAATGITGGQMLYRPARHDRDWTGGRNCWCRPDDLVEKVRELMELPQDSWDKRF